MLTFNASPTQQSSSGTTLTLTNKIDRATVRPAGWVISSYEKMPPRGNGSWINTQTATDLATEAFLFTTLYYNNPLSQSLYFSWQIGVGRNTPAAGPGMPIVLDPTTQATWTTTMYNCFTNQNYSDFNWMGHGNAHYIGGGEYSWSYLNYVNTTLSASTVAPWIKLAGTRWKMRKVTMWSCYSARTSPYYNWFTAMGIYMNQKRTLSAKNCALLFDDEVYSQGYGTSSACISKVALEFDTIWALGANPYPGGANPNYSMNFAYSVTAGIFPEIAFCSPKLVGCPLLPYSGMYDNELMIGDFHQVIR